ncbi:MAG: 30S ribosomal protein S4 [Candidatus Spechtbacteria bacterium SB0662_bin_43]|uniref:Small ribosomal subunit protein uS4 n=1 Tax=Candidatus Spechtbacteria bacterium SB0662_bin_43 TaxID=2604897 RepID=A0A845DBM5_9BACT|nr:30S ribosomal protein S4 [Candidatus Spechtbacteria bacterium SB0662_bin_43]
MPNAPRRSKSEYGTQLAEKQKIRNEYGLREKQFRSYFTKGKEPYAVFALLEQRLDSVVFRSGFASTRPQARQMVNHGHITVDGRKVTIPSYQVRVGSVIAVRESSRQSKLFDDYDFRMKKFESPSWIVIDAKKKEARTKAKPDMQEQIQPFNFQMVLEFYSR